MPAPTLIRPATKDQGKLIQVKYRFGRGLGYFDHEEGGVAILTNGDDRFGYLMPGPREVADMTGIAANFRVVAFTKHNDVNMIATTDGTDTKVYREESSAWVEKLEVLAAVAEPDALVSFHDGTDSIIAVGLGTADAFRYSTNDGTGWTTSTLTGTAKNMTRAYAQQDGATPRVVYCVDPDEVYFANSLDNSATVSTAENVGSASTSDDNFTSIAPDNEGNLMFGKRHYLFRRRELSDNSIFYEIVTPFYDDPPGDAGGQSDRDNFEHPIDMAGRLIYPVNGYTLGIWYAGRWDANIEPQQAGPKIPRLVLPINAMARAGKWLLLAIGDGNASSTKTVTGKPGGSNLEQNTFGNTSYLYAAEVVSDGNRDLLKWHGSLLTCTDLLRMMWFDEDDSYLFFASGAAELINVQQTRALFFVDDPQAHGATVTLNNGTVTAEFGRLDLPGKNLLRHVSVPKVMGLSANVTVAIGYRNEPGRQTTGAYKTHATYTGVEGAARGTVFPTSRTFEELWLRCVLTGNSNSYAQVEEIILEVEVL